LAQLVSLDFAEKRSDLALVRAQKQLAITPKSAELYTLLSHIHFKRGEDDAGEAALLKAVELNPQGSGPYIELGKLYAKTKRYDAALAKLEQLVRVDPRNISAHMLIGMVHEAQGSIPQAQAAYEQVLALNPRFGLAANNLAYLYSEHSGNMEKALQLAQTAKEMLPQEPAVSDTLGWILYKRNVYGRALSLLSESASKQPGNAETQYHLGMTHYKLGHRDAARTALSHALKLNQSFPGAKEAKQALAELGS
jgi:Flp pilus assembly protein TadD